MTQQPVPDPDHNTRQAERAAFRALADVLLYHVDKWKYRNPVNFSFHRFCDRVDRLCGTGEYAQRAPDTPDVVEWDDHRSDVLLRMLDRMNGLYDHLEDPRSGFQQYVPLLPARSTLPADDAGIEAFCRAVYTRLLPVPEATTVRGGFAARMRWLNASLSLYATYQRPLTQNPPPPARGADYHDDRRDRCLHLLLVQVDTHMHQFAEQITFQDAYYEARSTIMRCTVEARAALFKKKYGWPVEPDP